MGPVVVHLLTATICFGGSCHPALLGDATPRGEFRLTHYATRGYGGDVLVYQESRDLALAIHRVVAIPGQHRKERLAAGAAPQRIHVTRGCINIDPAVYAELVRDYASAQLSIVD